MRRTLEKPERFRLPKEQPPPETLRQKGPTEPPRTSGEMALSASAEGITSQGKKDRGGLLKRLKRFEDWPCAGFYPPQMEDCRVDTTADLLFNTAFNSLHLEAWRAACRICRWTRCRSSIRWGVMQEHLQPAPMPGCFRCSAYGDILIRAKSAIYALQANGRLRQIHPPVDGRI